MAEIRARASRRGFPERGIRKIPILDDPARGIECDLELGSYDKPTRNGRECVNAILDEEGVQFRNLGELVSSAILDDEVFGALDALILLCSGG